MLQSLIAENFDDDNRAVYQVEPNRAIGHAAGSRRHVRVLHFPVNDPIMEYMPRLVVVVVPALEVSLSQELRLLLGVGPQGVNSAEAARVDPTPSLHRAPKSHVSFSFRYRFRFYHDSPVAKGMDPLFHNYIKHSIFGFISQVLVRRGGFEPP